MKPKDKVELQVIGTAQDGRGIAKYNGLVVFVSGTVEGETVLAEIYTVHKTYATAGTVKVLVSSPFRAEAFCPVQDACGGCPLAHIQYDKQKTIKRQTVIDAMTRLGKFDIEDMDVKETCGMETPFRYRNKMVFPVSRINHTVAGGFYAPRSHTLVACSDCLAGERAAAVALSCVTAFLNWEDIVPYDEKTKKGTVRRVFVRTGYHSRQLMIVISSATPKIRHIEKLVTLLRKQDYEGYTLSSVILNINRKPNNLVLGEENITLWGTDTISDTLMGLEFSISPQSFFQVNPTQTEVLYQKALDFANIDKTTTVLDIYCGIGTISLCAAKQAKQVVGVEIVDKAISDAKENAKRNDIENATFYCGAAEDVIPELLGNGFCPDVVILDPPRKGSDEKTLSAILKVSPKRIVYVSCNPATLARDARFLADGGYTLSCVTPVDMFPNTEHVECVALFTTR